MRPLVVLDRSPYGNDADRASDELLVRVARRRGHAADVLPFDDEDDPRLLEIPPDAVVLLRADLRSDDDLRCVVRTATALGLRGHAVFPDAHGLLCAEEKAETAARLVAERIHVVPTRDATAQDPPHAFPCVAKPAVGWGGHGIVRCDREEDLDAAILGTRGRVVVQPLVPHVRTIVALVAGDRVVSSWAARPRSGEFRTNLRLGGTAEDAVLPPALAREAVRATAACGLRFASVEFLDDGSAQPPVCELNAMPGLHPEDPDDVAFAGAILDAVLSNAVLDVVHDEYATQGPPAARRSPSVSPARSDRGPP